MKKYLFLCAAIALVFSCKTTEPAEKYPNMVANVDPFSIGTVNASLDRAFSSKLARVEMDIIFYPRENEVALEFDRALGAMRRQFWNEEARQCFIEALAAYNEDFTNQRLLTNYNKSKTAYGKAKGRFQWKTMKISSTFSSSPVFELGYRFRDNSPFFAIYQKNAREETGKNSDGITESGAYSIYLTRAQAEELAKLFDKAYLLETVAEFIRPPKLDDNPDDYYNQGAATVSAPEIETVPEQAAASPDNTDEAAVDFEDDLEPDV